LIGAGRFAGRFAGRPLAGTAFPASPCPFPADGIPLRGQDEWFPRREV